LTEKRGSMNRATALIAAIALGAAGAAYALYDVMNEGGWPKTWPKELEPLRKQARTLGGPLEGYQHHAISFTKREEMERAWPHILKVKTKGAPVILVRGTNFFLGNKAKAGVVVHSPPVDQAGHPKFPEVRKDTPNITTRWQYTNYIELVVDGEVVDLNRLPLPADTPIVDQRFEEAKGK
jgi:hypothetical protein